MPRMTSAVFTGTAPARVGLLGNPSDGFGGKVMAFALRNFGARVTLTPRPAGAGFRLADDAATAADLDSLRAALPHLVEAAPLIGAAVLMFQGHCAVHGLDAAPLDAAFECTSDIPREVGMAGSSAIVTATLNALCAAHDVSIPRAEQAELALRAETELLGIAAGPQDRVIQAYRGFVWMDFSLPGPRSKANYERLQANLLPSTFVAWDPDTGTSSGVVHSDVTARWQRREPDVVAAIETFPRLAEEGLACLRAGDLDGFRARVDRNFDVRRTIWQLAERDLEMVRIGREAGAAVKFTGSGGAVVGVPRTPDDLPRLERVYRDAGLGFAVSQLLEP